MEIVKFVEGLGTIKLGPLYKTAKDYAALLDSECMKFVIGEKEACRIASVRQDVFEEFCAILVNADLPALELERETIQAQIGSDANSKT